MYKKDNELSLYLAVTTIFILLIGGAIFYNTTTKIKDISPENGSVVSTSTPVITVDFSSNIDKKKLKVFIDNDDITQRISFNKLKAIFQTHPLGEGNHKITVQLNNGSMRKRVKTSEFKVDTEAPMLTVIEPNPFTDVKTKHFYIKGKVEKESVLRIDGKRVDYSDDGSYSLRVKTRKGPYHIESRDGAGNITHKFVYARKRSAVKGIHIGATTPGVDWLFERVLKMVKKTELNALQIDVKDERGIIGYRSKVKLANEIGAAQDYFNLDRVIATCKKQDIYTIGRIVVFEDPKLALHKRDFAVKTLDGRIWRGRNGTFWVDPYCKEVWKYNVDLAKEAISHGFDEIQFDYTRFPTDGNLQDIYFPYGNRDKKDKVISSFLRYARSILSKSNAFISVDIFGLTALWDLGIGQNISEMAKNVDYICPMLYPSHYQRGNYGIANPNENPYLTIRKSLLDFKRKTQDSRAKIRPWLQSFSLGHDYSYKEIRDEINATEASGIKEWMLWNANSNYSKKCLEPE